MLSRGIIIFLIVYGTLGCFTSSFGVGYNELVVIGVTFVISIYLGLIFYKTWTKNVGYIVMFIFFLGGIIRFAMYIISGYYGMLNIVFDKIKSIMMIPSAMEYGEYIQNRNVTITICLCFLCLGSCAMMNSLISNYMSIIPTMCLSLPIALIGPYFGLAPNKFYAIMLMTGYAAVFVMKRSNHYRADAKDNDFKQKIDKKGVHYTYHSNGKITMQIIAMLSTIVIFLILSITLLFPAQKILVPDSIKKLRTVPDQYIARFVNAGFWGLFNRYSGAGGMNGGKLGGVAAVTPDYKTDLVLRMAPGSTEPIYLKAYVGTKYEDNQWKNVLLGEFSNLSLGKKMSKLEYDINRKRKGIIRGKIRVTNIDAAEEYMYIPSYSDPTKIKKASLREDGFVRGQMPKNTSIEVPWVTTQEHVAGKESQELLENNVYLDIPNRNKSVIGSLIQQAGLTNLVGQSHIDEISKKLADYFDRNYPYSLRPGMTPESEDAINYFIQKNKTGYCAHYASVTTLVYRALGIEARYVEGYVATFDDYQAAKAVDLERVSDWLKGKKRLRKTSVIDVNVNDSHAHAWVEVFDSKRGWRIVDITPANMEVAEEGSVWGTLGEVFGGASGDSGSGSGNSGFRLTKAFRVLQIAVLLALLWLVIKAIRFAIRKGKRIRQFHPVTEEALISEYRYLCKALRRLSKEFTLMPTHKSQIAYIFKASFKERLVILKNV